MKGSAASVVFALSLTSLVTRPAAGADILLQGTTPGTKVKVQIKKTSSNFAAHKIQYSAKHPNVLFTPGGGATDDPPANGATAVIFSATDCQCLTLAPAPTTTPGWTQSPASGTPSKYKWRDDVTKSTAQVAGGKIKLKKKDGITYGLDASPQGQVEVQITFGNSSDRFCSRFQAPLPNNDTPTKYKSDIFPPFSACSPVPGFCPCAPTTTTTTSTTSTTTTTTTTITTTTTSTTTTTTLPFCGAFVSKWGSGGSGDGQFSNPTDVAVDGSGNVFVADRNNSRIQKFTNSGSFLTKWGSAGSGDGQFSTPEGVAVDGTGNVFVADSGNNRIQKFTDTGTFLTKWGSAGSGDGQFSYPGAVAVDASGNVYVTEWGNDRVQKFTDTGTFLTKWGTFGSGDGQFNDPVGVALDGSGNVFVAEFNGSRVQKFTDTGSFLTKWGSFGTGDGQFVAPLFLDVDGSGNVFVVDRDNERIQRFTNSGTFLTKWGSLGSGDGQFLFVVGVAVDGSGNVFTSDYDTERIQKFACPASPSGAFLDTTASVLD
jgi:hypothetical protein